MKNTITFNENDYGSYLEAKKQAKNLAIALDLAAYKVTCIYTPVNGCCSVVWKATAMSDVISDFNRKTVLDIAKRYTKSVVNKLELLDNRT